MSDIEVRHEGYQVKTIRYISPHLPLYEHGKDTPSYPKWKAFITEILRDVANAEELGRIFDQTIFGRTKLEEMGSDGIDIFEKAIQTIVEADSHEQRLLTLERILKESRLEFLFVARAVMNCKNRELIVTEKGKVGLAPATAAIGDCVFLLRGGYMPFVLRERE